MIAIYVRQSIDKKDSISIDGQIDICKKEANVENVQIYSDKGFSGSNTNRPDLKRLILDIQQDKIKKVIVYRLDRISRSLLDFSAMVDMFKKNDVTFISCTEKFDTSTPIGNAMLSIIMVFAQLERETIQQRIKDNYYQRGKKGMFLGGPAPYGFDKEKAIINGINTSILTTNEKADTVIFMYDEYTRGSSLGAIAKLLNENKIVAPSGGMWNSLMVSRILKSPLYVKADADVYIFYKSRGCNISNELSDFIGENGCYLYGKRDRNAAKYTDVNDHVLSLAPHEGIVHADIWIECQKKLVENKQIKNTGKSTHTWLSGLVKCGKCGYSMSVTTFKDYKYFNCRGKTNYHNCEGNETIYVQDVEDIVKPLLIEKISQLEFKKPKENKKTSDAKIELLKIDEQIENLINHLANSPIEASEYINKKIVLLHEEKQKIINNTPEEKHHDIEKIKEQALKWDTLPLDKKKDLAKYCIFIVKLCDKDVNIYWKG